MWVSQSRRSSLVRLRAPGLHQSYHSLAAHSSSSMLSKTTSRPLARGSTPFSASTAVLARPRSVAAGFAARFSTFPHASSSLLARRRVWSQRGFCSPSSPSELPPSSNDSSQMMASILSKAKYHRVFDMLSMDERVKIPQGDYFKICSEVGLSQDEAESLRNSLHESGLILYFPRGSSEYSRINDEIIIKPKAVSDAFLHALDVDHRYVNGWSVSREKDLERLKEEFAPLHGEKKKLEYRARRYADRCISASMVGLTAMSAGIVRLTFWDLSWDIMEPVTYMLNLFTMTTGIYFFALYGNEFEYTTLYERIVATRLAKYYRRYKFNMIRYQSLSDQIARIETELRYPELYYLQSLGGISQERLPTYSPSSFTRSSDSGKN